MQKENEVGENKKKNSFYSSRFFSFFRFFFLSSYADYVMNVSGREKQ